MTGSNCPLVSVIIPYYNGRAFIRQALQSVYDQTYPRLEIIVVDDASPGPEDAACIQRLSDEMGFTLITHTVNQGIGPTLADAAEASRGDYIAELSQDDLYKPQKIARQIAELTDKKLNAVYTAGDILHQASGRIRMRETAKTREIILSGKAVNYLKLQNLTCISIQGLLAERSVFTEDIIPVWRDFLLDDWPVNIRLFEKYKVGFIEEPLWTGRGHKTNTSRNIWKWFGPQIEVVARMAPESLKPEAVGNRVGGMARRLLKQNGDQKDIIRLAFAGLMLTDSHEQHKKASRILKKISSKTKKAVGIPKFRLLKDFPETLQEQKTGPTQPATDWNSLGREIAEIVKSYPETSRVPQIGNVFGRLAHNSLRQTQGRQTDTVLKLALAALMMVNNADEENRILTLLRPFSAGQWAALIKHKRKILKSHCRFSIISVLQQEKLTTEKFKNRR